MVRIPPFPRPLPIVHERVIYDLMSRITNIPPVLAKIVIGYIYYISK